MASALRRRLIAVAAVLITVACGREDPSAIEGLRVTAAPTVSPVETPSATVSVGTAKPTRKPRPSGYGADPTGQPTLTDVPATAGPASTAAAASGAKIAGCPLFPSDNPWRQDVSKEPVDPRSAAYIESISGAGDRAFLHADFGSDPSYGIPYEIVPSTQKKVPITYTDYGDESDPGPFPIPLDAKIEGGSDRHVLVVQKETCELFELYNASRSANGWSASSGARFDLRSNALRPAGWTSADAAGLPIMPGLVRRGEAKAGEIEHALRFTAPNTQRGYVHPARHFASSSNDPDLPPMGLRVRLKKSYDISRFSGHAKVILTALKRYGMILADNGSSWFISGANDTGWNDDDLNQLKTVPGSAFEAVKHGTIHR